jgi:hypothetical protein
MLMAEEEKKKEEEKKHEEKKDEKNQNSKQGYFDMDLKTATIFAAAGVIMGYISFLINYTSGAALLAIAVFAGLYYCVKKFLHVKEEKKWWASPAVVYFILWLIIWTIFYNTVLL